MDISVPNQVNLCLISGLDVLFKEVGVPTKSAFSIFSYNLSFTNSALFSETQDMLTGSVPSLLPPIFSGFSEWVLFKSL